MQHHVAIAVLELVIAALGAGKPMISSREPAPSSSKGEGPDHHHLTDGGFVQVSAKSTPKMASIVGGYDAGTRGLPGYDLAERLRSQAPRNRPELPFKISTTELLTDGKYDPGSHHPTAGRTRGILGDTYESEFFENREVEAAGNTEHRGLPEEVEELALNDTANEIKEGIVGTSYSIGSQGQQEDNSSGTTVPEINQPGFAFGVPDIVRPVVEPGNNRPGFIFEIPRDPSESQEFISVYDDQGSQSDDPGTTVILESGPIFIREGFSDNPKPTTFRPSRFNPQFDDRRTNSDPGLRPISEVFPGSSDFDYVLSYG